MPLFTAAENTLLETVAARLVPGFSTLDAAGRKRFTLIIESALGDKPPALRRQLRLFLNLVHWLPVLRWAGSFGSLSPARQDAVLAWLQDCPIALLRKGFWGLKSLVFMGYYGQPELFERFAYRPQKDGVRMLHAG